MSLSDELRGRLQKLVDEHPIVLFMKGTKHFPHCGFSATVVEVLHRCGVETFVDVDVLRDPEVRQGVKEFSNWPTYPQLYVGGRFVGGADIVRELYESGELEPMLRRALGSEAASSSS